MEKLLNIDQVAEILGVAKATIYSWTAQKKIPHIKLSGRLLKFREKEIMDWISQRSVGTEPDTGKRTSHYAKAPFRLSDDRIEQIIRNAKEEVLRG